MDKIQIIGIGDDGLEGLTAAARQLIGQAELILGNIGEAEACFEEAYTLCQAPDFGRKLPLGVPTRWSPGTRTSWNTTSQK